MHKDYYDDQDRPSSSSTSYLPYVHSYDDTKGAINAIMDCNMVNVVPPVVAQTLHEDYYEDQDRMINVGLKRSPVRQYKRHKVNFFGKFR